MTVGELISKLKKIDRNIEVVVYDGEYDFYWSVETISEPTECKYFSDSREEIKGKVIVIE